ncbi:Na+:H+ antiporter [Striga asiatica]|uniref:Na+:H+ antiporter n=1 Tax=Striga asiatica TaxID=4170 RepID=A0A5A7PUE6_STRAF|nr:Na+:H+ antiporter [Striga asiatica]
MREYSDQDQIHHFHCLPNSLSSLDLSDNEDEDGTVMAAAASESEMAIERTLVQRRRTFDGRERRARYLVQRRRTRLRGSVVGRPVDRAAPEVEEAIRHHLCT